MGRHRLDRPAEIKGMTVTEIITDLKAIGSPLADRVSALYEQAKATKTPDELAEVERQLQDAFKLLNAKLQARTS